MLERGIKCTLEITQKVKMTLKRKQIFTVKLSARKKKWNEQHVWNLNGLNRG